MGKRRSRVWGWSGKHVKEPEVSWTPGRLLVLVGALLANVLFLGPFLMAWGSAADHARVLSSDFVAECVDAVADKPGPLPHPFATVRYERPYVLRLTWDPGSDDEIIVLCEYDPGDGDEEPLRVVRAWVEQS